MGKKDKKAVWIASLLILAGVSHMLEPFTGPAAGGLCFMLTTMLYTGLVLFWCVSVYSRFLPSRARRLCIAAGMLMLFLLLIRTVRYRCTDTALFLRYLWYLTYIPYLAVPVLFFVTCESFGDDREGRVSLPSRFFALSGAVLLGLVLTNDLHHLAFILSGGGPIDMAYRHGPVYVMIVLWTAALVCAGVVRLARVRFCPGRSQVIAGPILSIFIYPGLLLLRELLFSARGLRTPYKTYELFIFSCIMMIEVCIRNGLIPTNRDYPACFSALRLPVLITDEELIPRYRTAARLREDPELLRSALKEPVYPDQTVRLFGKRIHAGNVFWTADETAVRSTNERLSEANRMIEEENELKQAERKLAENRLHLESRNRIYSEISTKLYPAQQKVRALLKPERRTLPLPAVFRTEEHTLYIAVRSGKGGTA